MTKKGGSIKSRKRGRLKEIIEIGIVLAFFIFFSYLVQKNLDFFEGFIVSAKWGVFIFMLIEFLSIVIAPVTTLPLIAVASNLWGWKLTGVLSLLAWTLGSWVAFLIGRKYGTRIIKNFISLENLHKVEKRIPQKNMFLSVVSLRMIVPVDVLSYALGIFSKMKTGKYLLATIIGITPLAFLFSYLGTIPILYQIVASLAAFVTFLIAFFIWKKMKH